MKSLTIDSTERNIQPRGYFFLVIATHIIPLNQNYLVSDDLVLSSYLQCIIGGMLKPAMDCSLRKENSPYALNRSTPR